MTRPMLTKSLLTAGIQCRKRAWLSMHEAPGDRDASPSPQIEFGRIAGEIAREQWPKGLHIRSVGWQDAINRTRREMNHSPRRPLFEAAFRWGQVGIRADIVEPADNDSWNLIEVKTSTRRKPEHIDDCAIQAWVMEQAGTSLARIELALIDTDFVYAGDNDYSGLFYLDDVTDEVRERMESIPNTVASIEKALASGMPETPMGNHCENPWPCPFQPYCGQAYPEFPVSLLPNDRNGRTAELLREQGHEELQTVPVEILENPLYRRITLATQTGEPFLSSEASDLLADYDYPRHYLDFETASFPVPVWPETRPYQRIPFQWSCHTEQSNGETSHHGFLKIDGENPIEECAARLTELLDDDGPVFTYGHFDRDVIQKLANQVPNHAAGLRAIANRIVNLLPIVRDHYYHPAMKGSFSVKQVVPTIAPDLDYSSLEGVADGNSAQLACWQILRHQVPKSRSAGILRELDRYCAQDTEALIRIVNHLQGRSHLNSTLDASSQG